MPLMPVMPFMPIIHVMPVLMSIDLYGCITYCVVLTVCVKCSPASPCIQHRQDRHDRHDMHDRQDMVDPRWYCEHTVEILDTCLDTPAEMLDTRTESWRDSWTCLGTSYCLYFDIHGDSGEVQGTFLISILVFQLIIEFYTVVSAYTINEHY